MPPQHVVTRDYQQKIDDLRRRLRKTQGAVVAFSGGVDSALLVALTHQELGDRMLAVMGISPSVPERDRLRAAQFCQKRDIPFQTVETTEFSDPNYLSNPHNRCYYCKQALFEALATLSREKGLESIFDGTNASDLHGHRPGARAAEENTLVRAPFLEVGMTKDEVRRCARELSLEVADKPSGACLASRIPTNVPIEPRVLTRIDRAENTLRDMGFRQVRVRHHGEVAKVEVGHDQLEVAFTHHATIQNHLASFGWKQVMLNPKGYREK